MALINWAYSHDAQQSSARRNPRVLQSIDNLRVALPGVGPFKSVRSLHHGTLAVHGQGADRSVVLPKMEEIDVLALE